MILYVALSCHTTLYPFPLQELGTDAHSPGYGAEDELVKEWTGPWHCAFQALKHRQQDVEEMGRLLKSVFSVVHDWNYVQLLHR